jgi:argininosuccinate lyase
MKTLWQKPSSEEKSRDWFNQFTASEDRLYDQYLIPFDILGNIVQAKMLARMGYLNPDETRTLVDALRTYYRGWESGSFTLAEDDEDVHSAVEKRLTIDCGEPGKRIHTGRSRNDQVLTDLRLLLKERLLIIASQLDTVYSTLGKIRDKHRDIYFSGLTHTQPAMPTSVDAWIMGYQDAMLADMRQIRLCFELLDQLPLGSAAGYGAPYFETDRSFAAAALGFSHVQHAVSAVQLNRGVLEKRISDALGYVAHTYNRMASDIIYFVHPSFAFIHLSDDQTSGSSIMPQKRNPDAWELIRGSYSLFAGFSAQLGTISAGLISGYHRDLQLTKKTIIDATSAIQAVNVAVIHALSGLTFNAEACRKSLTPEVFATHEANRLVAGGIPFREAYQQAAQSVSQATVMSTDELKKSYLTAGSPGLPMTSHYDEAWHIQTGWVEQERLKLNQITYNLLHDTHE